MWVRGFPRKDPNGKITRVGGTALDVTALKLAEDQVQANLAKANSAWSEAEALRKATLALTEDFTWIPFWMRYSALWRSWSPIHALECWFQRAVLIGWPWAKTPSRDRKKISSLSVDIRGR